MTSPTCFFGILPVEIFHTILHYLPLKDIAIFDTAITDSSLRSLYLATLSSLVISRYQYQSLHSSTKNPLSWIVKRQIIVNEIYSDSFHPILLHVILNSKQKLTSLEIKSSIPLEYLELIPYCPLLTKVGFAKCSDIPLRVFARFFALHPSLTTLRISQTTNSSALLKLISIISANCPNLINLDFTSSSVDHQCIEELVKGKLDLLSLNLQETRISDRSIPIILDSFPNLQTFCIHGCQISVNQVNLCCQRFIFPSLTSDDPIRISSSIQALSSNLRERGSLLLDVNWTFPLICQFLVHPNEVIRMEALNFVDKNPRILIDGGFANLILDMALSDPKKATVRAALLMLCRTQVEILPATLPYLALIRSYISVIFRLTRPVTIMKRKKFQKKMFESDSDSDSNSESSDDSSSTSDSSDDDDDDSSTASSDNPGSQTDEFSIIDEKRQLRSVLLYLFKVATYEDLIASNLFLSYKDSDPHCGPFYAAIISHCVENGKNELLQHLIENGMISMLLNKKVLIKSVSLSFLH